jgi:Flp pilus assembly pilin Flp
MVLVMNILIKHKEAQGGDSLVKKHLQKLVRRIKRQSGQSLVEYALILALISVVAILVLHGIGTSVNVKLGNINGNLQ